MADVIELPDGTTLRQSGGATWYAGAHLATLGHSVAAIVVAGNEEAAQLRALGVDVIHGPEPSRTSRFHLRYFADGSRKVRFEALARPLTRADLPADLESFDLINLAPVAPADLSTDLMRAVAAVEGPRLVCDLQGFARAAEPNPAVEERIAIALTTCDAVKVSESEAKEITGVNGAEAAARALGDRAPQAIVLVTAGVEGTILCAKRMLHRVPALPVAAVETTGAGDVFFASFLAAAPPGKRIPFAQAVEACEAASRATAALLMEATQRSLTLSNIIEERARSAS